MINTLDDYIYRSLPEEGDFHTNPGLEKKVGPDGRFLPFFGDTVVFDLKEDCKASLAVLQKELYAAAGEYLAQALAPETFHMTLHDLNNSPVLSPELEAAMERSRVAVKPILDSWRALPPIRMRASWLFNMVNTSIVLGLVPADEESRRQLEGMYMALENILPLGYALCPHITMAYYRPGCLYGAALEALRSALHPVELEAELGMDALYYQRFSDMNHYRNY